MIDMDYLKNYYELLNSKALEQFQIAREARKNGFDPEVDVEISLARDLADRVESLLNISGVKEKMRELESQGMARDMIAFEITKMVARGELIGIVDREKRIDMAVRVGTAILTDGVLVAPTEGISKVKIKRSKDGEYVAIYYSGPIRSAGGTAAALTVLLADLARRENRIPEYKASDREVFRIVEEVNIYDRDVARLQYKPPDSDVEKIVRGLTVQVNGEPTEDLEVMNYKGVDTVETDRIRGGVPLVLCEGIAQKSKKLKKYVEKLKIDGWDFLDKLEGIKISVSSDVKVDASYLEGTVAGRPIIAYPSAKGGFRIRYGRSMTNGLMAKNVHYKTLMLLGGFIANGTHIKIEKPGKGAIITAHDNIHPPVVRLKNGDVIIDPPEELLDQVDRILFLGDILTTYGDFLKSNNPLSPSPYVEEWWALDNPGVDPPRDCEEAYRIAKNNNTPLYPKYVLFWRNIQIHDLKRLASNLIELQDYSEIILDSSVKDILENIYLPHRYIDGKIIIDRFYSKILMLNLGGKEGLRIILEDNQETDILKLLTKAAGVIIPDVVGSYVGARMGRPEKAKEREMDGSPNILFPLGMQRDFKRYDGEDVEVARFKCKVCGINTIYPKCQKCGNRTVFIGTYQGKLNQIYDLNSELRRLIQSYGTVEKFKGVKGLFSKNKIPEYIDKGYIRAKYGIPVNKDGTSRFDAINITMTHFRPKDINVSVDKLKELGYSIDYKGEPLERDDQIVELYLQDIIVPRAALDYLYRAGKFIDDILVNIYGKSPYYKFKSPEDVIGTLVITQSPHTSAGILARVIGWTDVNGIMANPFLHAAKRRNVDGDEDSIFLLLDGFLNFSKHYLESKTGGQMDAPIVLILNINPKEVDDEVYNIEIETYNLDFYRATLGSKMPSEVKIKIVQNVLDRFSYPLFTLTHIQDRLVRGPLVSAYKRLDNMKDKIDEELNVMKKIAAIDMKDAVQRIINDHFFPDIYGNLRKFSKQEFRCKKCNAKYRRPPLSGRCLECGGELQLTITKGSIQKYLDIAIKLADEYQIDPYYLGRLKLIKMSVESMFGQDSEKKQGGGLDGIIVK
ncbi:MAG: DNA polymerase II large subunit [Candidatus Anstonellales archaeon]